MSILKQGVNKQSLKLHKLELLIRKLSQQVLKQIQQSLTSVEKILDDSALQLLHIKYEQQCQSTQQAMQFLNFLISFLIDQLQEQLNKQKNIIQMSTRSVLIEEYQILEEAMQKAQAEIRKHIRIQQQFKIYLDSLEDKVEQLQRNIINSQLKYSHLSQNYKQIQRQNKELKDKILKLQQRKHNNSNDLFSNSRIYKDAFVSWKYTGCKSKKIMEKIHDKTRGSQKKSLSKKLEIEASINDVQQTSGSKKLFHLKNANNLPNQQESFKELTKTLQMRPIKQKKKNLSLFKYRTQLPQKKQTKLYRSNSVCH